MAQEIGIRICKRGEKKAARSGGRQDCATPYRHGNRPPPRWRCRHHHGNPVRREPRVVTRGKQGRSERRAEKKKKGKKTQIKGAEGANGQMMGLREGGGWRGEGARKDGKNERRRANNINNSSATGMIEGAPVPVECRRASRADAGASSPPKPRPLTCTLYSNLLPPPPPPAVPPVAPPPPPFPFLFRRVYKNSPRQQPA